MNDRPARRTNRSKSQGASTLGVRITLLYLMGVSVGCAQLTNVVEVSSPDHSVKLRWDVDQPRPVFTVTLNGANVLDSSPMVRLPCCLPGFAHVHVKKAAWCAAFIVGK